MITEIEINPLPKNIYELSWCLNDKRYSKFLTKASLITLANNTKAYPELREFVKNKIRQGDY